MVKEENKIYNHANKYVLQFLSKFDCNLIEKWKNDHQQKFKNIINQNNVLKPKRSLSEYLLFCSQERPKMIEKSMKENDGKINIHDVTRDLGKKWIEFKKLAEDENSEEYQRLQKIKHEVNLDRERFLIEKSKIPTLKEKPKNYFRSKYIYFCYLEREKNSKISFTELSKLWKEKKECPILDKQYESEKQISKIQNN
jgi:hypothetical protein